MDKQEFSAQAQRTFNTAMLGAGVIGGKAMKLATEGAIKIKEALPQTEAQRQAERRGKIIRGSIIAGATAVAGAAATYGSKFIKRAPFGESDAEHMATRLADTQAYPGGSLTEPASAATSVPPRMTTEALLDQTD